MLSICCLKHCRKEIDTEKINCKVLLSPTFGNVLLRPIGFNEFQSSALGKMNTEQNEICGMVNTKKNKVFENLTQNKSHLRIEC